MEKVSRMAALELRQLVPHLDGEEKLIDMEQLLPF